MMSQALFAPLFVFHTPRMRGTFAIVVFGVLAMTGACGGGNVMCGSAVGCGGDIVGSWAITSDCAEPSPRYLEGKYCDTAYSSMRAFALSSTLLVRPPYGCAA
jgi:hypothetical protein